MRVATREGSVVFSEPSRSIFARKMLAGDTRSFPPITTDQETLVELTLAEDGEVTSNPSSVHTAHRDRPVALTRSSLQTVNGRIRLASYLNPLDPLFFAASKQSVSVSDYTLVLRRRV
jgi:hypothetical protein